MFGGFSNDPFFRQPHNDIDRHFANMHSMMMADCMDPFSSARHPTRSNQNQLMRREDPFSSQISNPFSFMNSMMGNMGGIFGNMEQMMQNAANNPNAQVYSSSTVTSYSSNGNGAPKVYHASTETKQLPGGVRETRKAVRDSEKGIDKMAIGHHIGDKAHIIERLRKRDGELEENVNFENLDENEVNDFDREFEQRINRHPTNQAAISHQRSRHSHHNANYNQPLSIEDSHNRKDKKKSKPRH